jgi:pyrroline-5-carboxylate reductase
MGSALLRGWIAAGIDPASLAVWEPRPSPELSALLAERGIGTRPTAAPDTIVLAVKPQVLPQILSTVAPEVGPRTAVLSIAAGRTVESIANALPNGPAIVRAMPNLPAEIGRGITVAYANATVETDVRTRCEALLRAVGDVAWVEEERLLDAVTAVSGSGPAYVFHLVECLGDAGVAAGLSKDLAARLARATVTGAGELLHKSSLSAAELREAVTSPGGTTEAALSVLTAEPSLARLIRETVAAAARRSRELSR